KDCRPEMRPSMHAESQSLKDLFLAALGVAAVDRAAWLDHACGADTELRVRIERMLAAHDAPHNLLDGAAPSGASPAGASPAGASPTTAREAAAGDAPGA